MKLTAARKQAAREITMYRQGSGWIVLAWSDHYKSSELSGELTFQVARQRVQEARAERVAKLIDGDGYDETSGVGYARD